MGSSLPYFNDYSNKDFSHSALFCFFAFPLFSLLVVVQAQRKVTNPATRKSKPIEGSSARSSSHTKIEELDRVASIVIANMIYFVIE